MKDTIEAIYAAVPDVGCKGLCTECCGPLSMSAHEALRIAVKHGSMPMPDKTLTCDKLANGRCSIYADRPLVCRLFGAAEGLECPWGCKPQAPLLTREQCGELIARAERLKP